MPQTPTLYHIPICPFSQRLEILLALKDRRGAVRFKVVDITRPVPPELLAKTGGSSVFPVLETADGRILRESLVLLEYLEAYLPEPAIAQRDPYRRAVEQMLVAQCDAFTTQGYVTVLNQDPARREAHHAKMLALYAGLDAFLSEHAPEGPFLFEAFGWAETVYTPIFQRFAFLGYYEGLELPDEPRFARVRRWREACIGHPAAQQVTSEEIIKLYYDYAKGCGNGGLPEGRTRSSFIFEPDWRTRPWPPRDKYDHHATDRELGLV